MNLIKNLANWLNIYKKLRKVKITKMNSLIIFSMNQKHFSVLRLTWSGDSRSHNVHLIVCLSQKIDRFNSINSSLNLLIILSMNPKNRKNLVFKKIIFSLTIDKIRRLKKPQSLYRVFGKEGHTETSSNFINFWPEILPKAF